MTNENGCLSLDIQVEVAGVKLTRVSGTTRSRQLTHTLVSFTPATSTRISRLRHPFSFVIPNHLCKILISPGNISTIRMDITSFQGHPLRECCVLSSKRSVVAV